MLVLRLYDLFLLWALLSIAILFSCYYLKIPFVRRIVDGLFYWFFYDCFELDIDETLWVFKSTKLDTFRLLVKIFLLFLVILIMTDRLIFAIFIALRLYLWPSFFLFILLIFFFLWSFVAQLYLLGLLHNGSIKSSFFLWCSFLILAWICNHLILFHFHLQHFFLISIISFALFVYNLVVFGKSVGKVILNGWIILIHLMTSGIIHFIDAEYI